MYLRLHGSGQWAVDVSDDNFYPIDKGPTIIRASGISAVIMNVTLNGSNVVALRNPSEISWGPSW
jgi:hypothetical protein